MKKVQYSRELLQDFNKLVKDFWAFMAPNLSYYKNWSGFSDVCKKKAAEVMSYSSANAKRITDDLFFEEPLFANESGNREKMEKNLSNTVTFFYEYLKYAEPIVNSCFPDDLKNRFADVKKHYLNFCAKHLS